MTRVQRHLLRRWSPRPLEGTWSQSDRSGAFKVVNCKQKCKSLRSTRSAHFATSNNVFTDCRALYFTTYQAAKLRFLDWNDGQESNTVNLASAAVAGIHVANVTSPIWVIKTRMQLQSKSNDSFRYRNSFHCATEMWRQEGLRGFYKGLTASYFGNLSTTARTHESRLE
jgi:hypothetical protein